MRTAFALVAILLAAFLPAQPPPADLVLRNGKVVTVDHELGTVAALACRGGRIVAAGTNDEIARHVGDHTTVLDLRGRLALPGFIEGHGHFTGIGEAKQILDLTKVNDWDEVVAMVAKAVQDARPGEWIRGRGWHQEKWSSVPEPHVEGFPVHDSLSAVSPANPVALTHASGHASFFNQKAMELAGVGKDTKNPAGGEILRKADGTPSGLFRETAAALVHDARTAGDVRRARADAAERLRKAIRLADQECLSKGVTSFQDAGSSLATIDVLKELAERGELGVRLWVMVRDGNAALRENLARYRLTGAGDGHLTVRAIKRSIDGALGARGAWLLAPYADLPDSCGLNTSSVASIEETAALAREHGFQLCVHAIGDRANREVLDLYERAFAAHGGTAELQKRRWRVEHAQHLHPTDVPRFGALGVVASMQGIHCTSDAPYVPARLGPERAAEGAYVWQSLLRTGAVVINGTDAPVEDVDPLASFDASVTRRLANGATFHPKECMTREQALHSYTRDAAWAAFEEDVKGSLAPGKLADVVVLSHDVLTCPEADLRAARVDCTIVGGRVRFERPGTK
jgi:predicted amidohydrolase YtcJ